MTAEEVKSKFSTGSRERNEPAPDPVGRLMTIKDVMDERPAISKSPAPPFLPFSLGFPSARSGYDQSKPSGRWLGDNQHEFAAEVDAGMGYSVTIIPAQQGRRYLSQIFVLALR